MQIPSALIESLLRVKGFDKNNFIGAHNQQPATSIRINPAKWSDNYSHLLSVDNHQRVSWSSQGFYLDQRPSFTLDPLFHAGVYYVQEASSMFLEQALKQTADLSKPLKILDLCAAPGGKSTLIQSLISNDSILVSNEVIRSRSSVLEENLSKWGAHNVIITNNDPAIFQRLEDYFDVIVVDAPCSGSGLFRKDPAAIDEWSEDNVQLCSHRQQRILADVYPALKKGGILIYSTCSYSEEENEYIADWLLESFALSSLQLSIAEGDGIVETYSKKHAAFGYRFFPGKVKGEGFFISCFRKLYGDEYRYRKQQKTRIGKISKSNEANVRRWLLPDTPVDLWSQGTLIFAFPTVLEKDLLAITAADFYIRKAGVRIGSIAGKDLLPDHDLALSNLVNREVPVLQLKRDDALQYLRKEEVKTLSTGKGWTIVQYEGTNLGWIKVLSNRSNNYYPKEWRILKSGNE